MNPIEKLIAQHCPEGVEFKSLGELCEITKGQQLNKTKLLKKGEFAVINGGINPSGFWSESNFPSDRITISQGGASAGYVNFMTEAFWAGAHCYVIENEKESILYKFLYYVLKNQQEFLMKAQYGAGIPALAKKTIETLEIPLPPLIVQEKIVEILDKFTELQKELDLRRKQYHYYREKLLKRTQKHAAAGLCPATSGVEFKSLGEVCTTLPKGTLKTTQLEKEGYPVINSGRDLYGYYSQFNNEGNAFTIAARGEYAGFANFMDSKFWAGGLCYPYRSSDEGKLLTKFIFYYLKVIEFDIMNSLVARGSIPAINKSDCDKITIPLPPLSVQNEIVEILDKFDALAHSLSEGLPAEISARKKQYEHYRERLLSFKELEGES